MKLKDRIDSYQESSDYKLLNRIPVVISVNGRSFSKLTSLLDKPYSKYFTECMLSTMLKLCSEIEGAIFGYQFNDEIIIIVRNDNTLDTLPWYNNKIQKICSISSSIATLQFNNYSKSIEDFNLVGDAYFYSSVFSVPNITEAINTVVSKQQQNFHMAIQFACFYELLKKYDKNNIKEMLAGLSIDEKIDLLEQECNIEFDNFPVLFRRGSCCYKTSKIVSGAVKNKWVIDTELPIFTKEHSFLSTIFKNGGDVIRKENL